MTEPARRILVLQTTRMGDMLQTSPLIRLLRNCYPHAFLAVMVRKMSLPVAERIPGIDEILIYDEDEIYLNLRRNDCDSLLAAYKQVETYVDDIKKRRFDVAYNCTQSIGSALLLKLADVPLVIGAHYSLDWQFVLRGKWTNYLFTSLRHRTFNDFNLSDVFRNLAFDDSKNPTILLENLPKQVEFALRQEDRDRATELLACEGVVPDDFMVCFQLGASESQKRWPPFRFAELAHILRLRYKAKIVLLGVEAERPLGEEFTKLDTGPSISFFGKTSLGVLAAVLERSKLLVTNDTGTMHVAAAVRCPTVLVSVGTVHFRETGPYAPGNYAIESTIKPDLKTPLISGDQFGFEMRAAIKPDAVAKAVDLLLNDGNQHPSIPEEECLKDVVIYRSDFAPDGCLEWYPVICREFCDTDLFRMAFRSMWLSVLVPEGCFDKSERIEVDVLTRMLKCFRPADDVHKLRYSSDSAKDALRALADMAAEGIKNTENLIELLQVNKYAASQEYVRSLMNLDEKIRLLGELHPEIKPLTSAAGFERNNLEGSNPLSLAQATWQIYHELQTRCRVMEGKLDRIMALYESVFYS